MQKNHIKIENCNLVPILKKDNVWSTFFLDRPSQEAPTASPVLLASPSHGEQLLSSLGASRWQALLLLPTFSSQRLAP